MKFGIPTLIGPCQARPCALPSPMSFYSPHTLTRSISDLLHTPPQLGRLLQAWPGGPLPQDQPRPPSSSRPAPISVARDRPSVTTCARRPPSLMPTKRKEGLLCAPLWPQRPRVPPPPESVQLASRGLWGPRSGLGGTSGLFPCPFWAQGSEQQPSINPGDRGPLWAAPTAAPPHLSSLPDSCFCSQSGSR